MVSCGIKKNRSDCVEYARRTYMYTAACIRGRARASASFHHSVHATISILLSRCQPLSSRSPHRFRHAPNACRVRSMRNRACYERDNNIVTSRDQWRRDEPAGSSRTIEAPRKHQVTRRMCIPYDAVRENKACRTIQKYIQ